MTILFVLFAAALVALFVALVVYPPRPTIPAGWGVDPSATDGPIFGAYLSRADWFRRFGAVSGLVVAVEVGIIFHGAVGVSTGIYPLFADVLAMPMLGSLVGVIAAEAYNVRRRYRGARVADLTDRRGRYRRRQGSRQLHAWTGAASAVSLVAVAMGQSRAIPLVVVMAAALIAIEIAHRYVERRSRPALSVELEAADDLIRSVAAHRLDRSGLGIAVLILGWALMALLAPLESVLVGAVIGIGSLILAFRVWRSVGRMPARIAE